MQQLTLIRHGLTSWNTSGKFQGHSDVPLSEAGKAQVEKLAKHLQNIQPDVIHASPLIRALETAKTVFPKQEIITDERLKELNFGEFEGHTQQENEKHPAWQTWAQDPFKRCAPQGESYEVLRYRMADWFKDLPDVPHIVAVAHSGSIRMLLSHVLGIERPRYRKRIYVRHTSVSRILIQGNEAVIERVNDTQHLNNGFGDPFAD